MSNDLRERLLRVVRTRPNEMAPVNRDGPEAWAEIERLTAENERLKKRMADMMPIAGGNPFKHQIIGGFTVRIQEESS